ncbi:glutamate receptor 2.8-like isoform X2 [Syzygium oleosum]|uniref:glutamate receptor 2.8-like isoform X2 n=1 Tax=Syzygium oleosum TaxID=219896 RepID=UPI0011D1A2EF|nr:glutamate receptor 2.8-like isoform X2 [Syzygium oleosum]
MEGQRSCLILALLYFLHLASTIESSGVPKENPAKEMIQIGLIFSMNSTIGRVVESCISMARSDFYGAHPDYRTQLSLLIRDPKDDIVDAASAVLDLMENEEVHAILGPQWSSQAKFVIDLGVKAQVPIISFSATSPSLSPTQSHYFVRTAYEDSLQVGALAAVVQAYGWREIALVYEDTEYGKGLVPYLGDAFQKVDARITYRSVIPPSPEDIDIVKELNKLLVMQTRVFLVHMTAVIGSRFFVLASEAGMVSEDFAWIVTDGLSSLLDPVSSKALDSMQGVVGVRPHVPPSESRRNFEERWTKLYAERNSHDEIAYLSLFGLWAYDTVTALAIAGEMAWEPARSRYLKPNRSRTNLDFSSIGISEMGPKLLDKILSIKFQGLSGEFNLPDGQLQPIAFEIFNVVGQREEIIGYWTSAQGLSPELNQSTKEEYTASANDLKPPTWPGNTLKPPKGWVMPISGKKLRIGVPQKDGFTEFFKIEWDPHTGVPSYSGFAHDMFLAVLDALPFAIPYQYVPYVNESGQSAGTYDEMLYEIKLQKVDAVVGDTTIVANRSSYVDFTLPYLESGVAMIVAIKDDERRNMWIFLKPLSWNLWLTTGLAFIFTGFVVWLLEHRTNEEFRGRRSQQIGLILWFSFSTLVFAHREKIANNLTRLVLTVWVFVVLILTQSYTASLTSFLTVQRLTPKFVEVQDLIRNHLFVGYSKGSFVRGLLVRQLNFDESKLIPYSSPEEYHEALSKGSENGGVAAIFDELPFIKIFLARYCNKYKMVGPTYKTDGFGFAFPLRSPLVSYISRAILTVTQDKPKMDAIEGKYFCSQSSCQDQDATIFSDNLSLSVYSFGGLFIITGIISVSSVLIYVVSFFHSHWPSSSAIRSGNCSLWSEFLETANDFFQEHRLFGCLKRNRSCVVPTSHFQSGEASPNNEVELIARTPNVGGRPILILHV